MVETKVPRVVVTTSLSPSHRQRQRAQDIAARCGAPFVPRKGSLHQLQHDHNAHCVYTVLREREEILFGEEKLFLHPGMLFYKRKDGLKHPLIRAVSPENGSPIKSLIDGTLGLAQDAIHMATVLPEVQIKGFEANPFLHALLESGLQRMSKDRRAWASAASRISPVHGEASMGLSGLADKSADVVYLDPMFTRPLRSGPSFGLLRHFAHHAPLSETLLREACRVARLRVVLKCPGAQDPPALLPPETGWNRRVRGGVVDYLVAEFELTHPVYETPDLGTGPQKR